MDSLITAAETGFATTTGFSVESLVTWTSENLIQVFLGSGVALLYNLRYWLAAIVMIAVIIYFAFRFFRFFRS